jgi:hypothetical protein
LVSPSKVLKLAFRPKHNVEKLFGTKSSITLRSCVKEKYILLISIFQENLAKITNAAVLLQDRKDHKPKIKNHLYHKLQIHRDKSWKALALRTKFREYKEILLRKIMFLFFLGRKEECKMKLNFTEILKARRPTHKVGKLKWNMSMIR